MPVGQPFRISEYYSPAFRVSPESAQWSRIHVLDRQVLLTMVTTTGNLWRLADVDR